MRYFVVFLFVLCISCAVSPYKIEKINGVSFVAAPNVITEKNVEPVVNIHANYAAIMPFGFLKKLNHPEIIHNTNKQWFGETKAGAKQYITQLREKGIKIMIKPQIWVWNGEFTGLINMNTETNWEALEQYYTSFIMTYVDLAETVNAEIFCIGTELELFIKNRPKYWHDLINKIKKKYKGKLTYAANWDEYKRTPFWNELDYIGIDAYFPVSDKKTPTYNDCIQGWKTHKPIIKQTASTYKKPILFTEYGYRSVDYAGRKPWVSARNIGEVNLEAQINTTKALYNTFWHENWFVGGFIWKWFHNYEKSGGKNDPMFTPQNKPVEAVIKENHYKFN